eukprot:scaffold36132_cov48-Phaeocystis_antarctica.AAC.1
MQPREAVGHLRRVEPPLQVGVLEDLGEARSLLGPLLQYLAQQVLRLHVVHTGQGQLEARRGGEHLQHHVVGAP